MSPSPVFAIGDRSNRATYSGKPSRRGHARHRAPRSIPESARSFVAIGFQLALKAIRRDDWPRDEVGSWSL